MQRILREAQKCQVKGMGLKRLYSRHGSTNRPVNLGELQKQHQRWQFMYCRPDIVLGFGFSFTVARECMHIKTSSLNSSASSGGGQTHGMCLEL